MDTISNVLGAFSALGVGSNHRDDDIIDRLNHWVMYGLLIAFAVCVSAKQYVGLPIYCWLPVQYSFLKRYKGYASHYCWVTKLYSVDFADQIPREEEDRYYNDVGFYRWAPIFFVFLAFMYRIPYWIWCELKKHSGISVSKVSCMTLETAVLDQKHRDERLSHVAQFIHRWITARPVKSRPSRSTIIRSIRPGKRSGNYLVTLYLIIKFLYILNVVGQFCIISNFLDLNYWSFGFQAMGSYFAKGEWEDKHSFPRIALCDLKLRMLTSIITETIQCVLGINLFLEKLFLIVWFCSIFVLIANILCFVKWVWNIVSEAKTTQFLLKYSGVLRSASAQGGLKEHHYKVVRTFAQEYLGQDGVFLMRIVAANTSELLTLDLLRQMWLTYRQDLRDNSQNETHKIHHKGHVGNGEVKRFQITDV